MNVQTNGTGPHPPPGDEHGRARRTNAARRLTAVIRAVVCTLTIWSTLLPAAVAAQESSHDGNPEPPFELGLAFNGIGTFRRPGWGSALYGAAGITGGIRLIDGLYVTGGFTRGIGIGPSDTWIDYDQKYRVKTTRGSPLDQRWYGLRYELPLERIGQQFLKIYSAVVGVGKMETGYGVVATHEDVEGNVRKLSGDSKAHAADMDGIYVETAARWKWMTSDAPEGDTSWFNALGLDFGLRYVYYTSASRITPYIEEPPSGFSAVHVFGNIVFKMNLFY